MTPKARPWRRPRRLGHQHQNQFSDLICRSSEVMEKVTKPYISRMSTKFGMLLSATDVIRLNFIFSGEGIENRPSIVHAVIDLGIGCSD